MPDAKDEPKPDLKTDAKSTGNVKPKPDTKMETKPETNGKPAAEVSPQIVIGMSLNGCAGYRRVQM